MEKLKKIPKIRLLLFSIFILIISAAKLFYNRQTLKKATTPLKTSTQITSQPDEIRGKIITLRRLKREYFRNYHEAIASPNIRKPLYLPLNVSFEWTKNYLERELKKEAAGEVFLYVIFDNKDNKLIGSLEIRKKNPKDPGQFGCWLTENHWGGQKIQEAIKLISDAYFKFTNADSFSAHVEMWNLRSYYALKKAHFKLVDFYYENGKATRYILEMRKSDKSVQ